MPISDQHSITYRTDELQIEIAGIRLDALFPVEAVLACDPKYSFYVKSIALPGTVIDKLARPSMFSRRPRKEVMLNIDLPEKGDMSATAHLFRLIEAAIYEDEKAIEAWNAEKAEAA